MDEVRTKLVCNLNMDDFFKTEIAEGTWRRTPIKVKLQGVVYYECRQLTGNEILHLRGIERVKLIGKGDKA